MKRSKQIQTWRWAKPKYNLVAENGDLIEKDIINKMTAINLQHYFKQVFNINVEIVEIKE